MRNFVLLTTLAVLSCPLFAQQPTHPTGTFTQYSMVTADGLTRTYAVYAPKLACNAAVVFLHGTLTSINFAQPYALKNQWEAIADSATTMIPCIVWPLSTLNPATNTMYWNVDGAAQTFVTYDPDDLGFIATVIQTVQAQYNISPNQTFVSGMSSGGYMTQAVGDRLSAFVAAIAPVSGAQYISPAGYQFLLPILSNPVSVLRSNGTADPVVPGCGGTKTFWNNTKAASPSMDADFAYWTTQNKTLPVSQSLCTNGVPTPGLLSLDATGGLGNAEVLFVWQWNYSSHMWPPLWEQTIWTFFQTHGRVMQ